MVLRELRLKQRTIKNLIKKNPREGYLYNEDYRPKLKSKVNNLEGYLGRIKDPALRQRYKL